jgi:hypothetical protein
MRDKLIAACRALDMKQEESVQLVRTDRLEATRLLSAPASKGIFQALEYSTARLNAFLVCLAPNDDTSWRDLDRRWRETAGSTSRADCVGRVRLFYALYDGDDDVERLADAVRTALPDGSITLDDTPTAPSSGFYLWEASRDVDDRLERVLVLIGPSAQESVSDSWVWPSMDSSLRPLPGYLWELAKVRHEARRFAERRLLSQPDELYDRASRFETDEKANPPRTEARERTLQALQRETALAEAGEATLRTMRRTVEAAAHNARIWLASWAQHLPVPVPDGDAWAEDLAGPIGHDRGYVAWLLTEISDAADIVRDTVEYAKPMARIGSAELEQRLRDLSERSEFLTVLQTSVIAAAGLALAATQALNYRWPTYASLQTPFIVSVTWCGLFLPLAMALRPTTRLRRRLWVGFAGAGFAASAAWFVVTWLTRWQTGHPARIAVSLAISAAAALVAVAVWLGWHALRTRHTPH